MTNDEKEAIEKIIDERKEQFFEEFNENIEKIVKRYKSQMAEKAVIGFMGYQDRVTKEEISDYIHKRYRYWVYIIITVLSTIMVALGVNAIVVFRNYKAAISATDKAIIDINNMTGTIDFNKKVVADLNENVANILEGKVNLKELYGIEPLYGKTRCTNGGKCEEPINSKHYLTETRLRIEKGQIVYVEARGEICLQGKNKKACSGPMPIAGKDTYGLQLVIGADLHSPKETNVKRANSNEPTVSSDNITNRARLCFFPPEYREGEVYFAIPDGKQIYFESEDIDNYKDNTGEFFINKIHIGNQKDVAECAGVSPK